MQVLLPSYCRIVNVSTNTYRGVDVICTILKQDKKINRSLILIPDCGEYWFDTKDLISPNEINIIYIK